ncbi:MAG: acylneuraminate cytidylyltransferase family protein [Flammeovirgaceae bacterium]
MKKVIAIIPARAGSKGVVGKNIKSLNGKPLISFTIEEAKKSKFIDKLIVSTDSKEIADISLSLGASVPFIRPSELSTDSSLTFDVIKHAMNFLKEKDENYDIIVLLQPTTPFRKVESIDEAIQTLKKSNKYTSVVSVVDVEGNHPLRMKKIEGDYLTNYIDQGFENMNPRNELPKVYIRSGAIYAILTKNFYEEQSLVSNLCSPIILDKIETINIDSPLDFEFCEFILNKTK